MEACKGTNSNIVIFVLPKKHSTKILGLLLNYLQSWGDFIIISIDSFSFAYLIIPISCFILISFFPLIMIRTKSIYLIREKLDVFL